MLTISEQEFNKLSQFIRSNYGIKLGKEKVTLIVGRLGNTLEKMGMKSYSEYFDYLISEPTGKAAAELVNKITTNHTFFMREVEHFRYFKEVILPWLSTTVKDRDLKIWSAGCSSGEEPYTLAMILDEFFGQDKRLWNANILATDISTNVLKEASLGIYSEEKIKTLPQNWIKKYFKPYDAGRYTVVDTLKRELVIRQFNLMEEKYPFKKKFHVIFCRNVMIYFDEETKRKLVNKFYEYLVSGGYLFIGHSETLGREGTSFRYLQPAVYRKD